MAQTPNICLNRRGFLTGVSASFASWAMLPRIASAAGAPDPRFLTVILRGALDGLAAVAPIGDPHFTQLRPEEADMVGLSAMDGLFALNPALKHVGTMFERGEAMAVHAVATAYRGRSHFDGQDVLESGYGEHRRADSGWLNRALASMPGSGTVESASGLAVGPTVPLILRGEAPVTAWGPQAHADPSADTVARLLALYADTDPRLHDVLEAGLRIDETVSVGDMMGDAPVRGLERTFVEAARGAGRLLADPAGPRVGALSYDGWDTHANDGVLNGRLFRQLSALDAALNALREEMAEVWDRSVIAVVTEFGRTASENGSSGTDHGTASAMFLLGGAVKGGRVLADWPGLAANQLHEGRDVAPTTDMRAVLMGVLQDHLGLDRRELMRTFPDATNLEPVKGLVRAI